MQWYLCSCKFLWVFYAGSKCCYSGNTLVVIMSHHRAMVSVHGLSRAQRSLPAPHTECVEAAERSAESWISSFWSPCESPQAVIVLSRPTVNSAVSLVESTAKGIPPICFKRSHFLRGCPFFTHQKVESYNTKGMWWVSHLSMEGSRGLPWGEGKGNVSEASGKWRLGFSTEFLSGRFQSS